MFMFILIQWLISELILSIVKVTVSATASPGLYDTRPNESERMIENVRRLGPGMTEVIALSVLYGTVQ